MIIYWTWGVPYFQRSQCWWALVQCVMIQCKILMFIFAIRIHVEYTFPNDGFPTANNLRIQIRAVTVESSFAKSQHLAGCFTFPLRFTKKSRQHKNPQQAVKFRFHLAPRKKPIFDTTGTKKHVSFPQSPLEAALSISTYPGTAVQKCPGSIMILFLLNPMIVGHLTIFVPQMILYIDIYIYIYI